MKDDSCPPLTHSPTHPMWKDKQTCTLNVHLLCFFCLISGWRKSGRIPTLRMQFAWDGCRETGFEGVDIQPHRRRLKLWDTSPAQRRSQAVLLVGVGPPPPHGGLPEGVAQLTTSVFVPRGSGRRDSAPGHFRFLHPPKHNQSS